MTFQNAADIPIDTLAKLSEKHRDGLKRLGLYTVSDILFYAPARYSDPHAETSIGNLTSGESVTLYGVLSSVVVRRSFRGHMPMTEAILKDNAGSIKVVWFNQAYIGKLYPEGSVVKLSGHVEQGKHGFELRNPSIEHSKVIPTDIAPNLFKEARLDKDTQDTYLIPIYRETKGVSSQFILHCVKRALEKDLHTKIVDPIPQVVREALHLPSIDKAILYLHLPKTIELTVAARKRFSFQEIFLMKLYHERERALLAESHSYQIDPSKAIDMLANAPFTPTKAQIHAITTMVQELQSGAPMNRLLEGDVGSGKTFVAATLAHAVTSTFDEYKGMPLQVAYMAPTETLAKQHFETFCESFVTTKTPAGLLVGKECRIFPSKSDKRKPTGVSKSQLLTWIREGKVSIVIGTHALIQKNVTWRALALVIVDEQHRFGIKQRSALLTSSRKNNKNDAPLPHLLSMSATPIPRTLALSLFGDLDITVLDELPKGRKPIITEHVLSVSRRKEIYENVRNELQAGRQVYVICPRIESLNEEEAMIKHVRTVEDEAKRLAYEIFPEYVVDVLHGGMKPKQKDEAMKDFLEKRSDILVATSVIEVGVNVPNATVIIIEHADRFGLAQLHQLRGRVGRSTHQSYCFLFSDSTSESAQRRLSYLVKATSGFLLAELDMKERGIGALIEGKQWGVSDIAMEALSNPKLVELAAHHARELIREDMTLSKHKELRELLEKTERVHME